MAVIPQSKGKCYICKKEFSKGSIKSHLVKCNDLGTGKTKYFLLKVEDSYNKNYWLYLQAKVDITLDELDDFLRDIWLECCGHLSSFTINNIIYDKYYDEDSIFNSEKEEMSKYKLKDVLKKDTLFIHEYDFGSTTQLKIKVVDNHMGYDSGEGISLFARNNKPEYKCKKCGEDAAYILTDYALEKHIELCDNCMENYDDSDEDLIEITITNSPRMGVCVYDGSNDVYELDE